MTNSTSQDRITSLTMTGPELISALCCSNPGALRVLAEWFHSSPMAVIEMLSLDTKRLYDNRIWDLYKLCGMDIERFKYHVQVELPNQETGELSVTGPHSPDFKDKEFWVKRRFGKSGSFWALENPPSEANYEYPIK
jgi:hypothetical protein